MKWVGIVVSDFQVEFSTKWGGLEPQDSDLSNGTRMEWTTMKRR